MPGWLFAIICVSVLLIPSVGCASKISTTEVKKQVATVQRGNMTITVSVDGNLVMPQAFDLRFGAPGDVKDVFVEEGDFVKAGTVLATLDNTAQRLDIMSANNSMQMVLSNLYQTVPRLPQFPTKGPNKGSGVGYSFYYPSATILSSFEWAREEVSRARGLFQAGKYTEAASELYVSLSDLESCAAIFEDTISNPMSGLGNTSPLIPDDISGITYFQILQDQSFESVYTIELRKVVFLIRQAQANIEALRRLTAQKSYAEAESLFELLFSQMENIGKAVRNNVNVIRAHSNTAVYGKDISLYFYRAAEEKLNAALKAIEDDGLNSVELDDNLRVAQHYMQLCNAILGSNDYVLQHGLSLKNEQQYNIDLANALVTLGNRRDDFLKTIVLAPFDGTVVSVGVKKNDVLSAMDYSSKTAIQLVDTTAIKFEGLVDEIDILKIKTGQKARITVDAVPDKEFTGTVTFISPYGSKDTGTVVKFSITIKLDPTDVELKGGLTATADIAVASIQNVLLVPVSAITTTPTGSFVTVIINEATGQTEKRKITVGNQNYRFAEVVSGLKEGDKVTIEEKVPGAPVTTGFPRPQGPPPPPR